MPTRCCSFLAEENFNHQLVDQFLRLWATYAFHKDRHASLEIIARPLQDRHQSSEIDRGLRFWPCFSLRFCFFSCTWRQAMTAPTAAVRLNVPWLPGDMKLWFGVLRASHPVMVA